MNAAISAAATAKLPIAVPEIRTSPKFSGIRGSSGGTVKVSPPQIASTLPWMMLAMPMVAINTDTAEWPDSGRSTSRSTSTASSAIAPSASANAGNGLSPKVTFAA